MVSFTNHHLPQQNSTQLAHEVLQKYFGYSSFREGQLEIITSILNGRDTLAIRSTGSGKSICFQVPALSLPHLTLVISPLISLMSDQVFALRQKNIPAAFLNSTLTSEEMEKIYLQLKQQRLKMLYLSPEKLQTAECQRVLKSVQISFVAVDEAHCVSMWGHDFRPSYTQIAKVLQIFSVRPIVAAFTATATPLIAEDISCSLKLQTPVIFKQSALRHNLQLIIFSCQLLTQKQLCILKILLNHSGQSGIIYCVTRKATEELAALLNQLNFNHRLSTASIMAYHGGMESSERQSVQDQFIANRVKIIVATNAFGMGVDKSNIRFVIHYQLPANIENYYQEVGRAGRDGQLSKCYLLYYQPDILIQSHMIGQASPEQLDIEQTKFRQFLVLLNSPRCLQYSLADYFGEKTKKACKLCSHCQTIALTFSNEERWRWQCLHQQPFFAQLPIHLKLLLTLLSPISSSDWQRIPGVGVGIMKTLHLQQ